MRWSASSSAVLAATLLGAGASAERIQCLRDHAAELAQSAACGDQGSIQYCLSSLLPPEPQLFSPAALEACLVNAGCTAEEARIEAAWDIRRCDVGMAAGTLGELRRRSDATTTSDSTTQETTGSTAASTAAVTTTATTATKTATTKKTTASTTCYTTIDKAVKTCPVQSTGTASGKTLSCFTTTTPSASCISGMLCSTDTKGNDVCLVMKNSLDTAGIIITVCFTGAIAVAAALIMFFCCRERSENARMERAAEAADAAKSATVAQKRSAATRNVSANRSDSAPLMAPTSVTPPESRAPSSYGDMSKNPFQEDAHSLQDQAPSYSAAQHSYQEEAHYQENQLR